MSTLTVPITQPQSELLDLTRQNQYVWSKWGVGTGKSFSGGLTLYDWMLTYPGYPWMLNCLSYTNASTGTAAEAENAWDALGLKYKQTGRTGQAVYDFGNLGVVHTKTAQNWKKSFLGGNFAGAVSDEVCYWEQQEMAINKMIQRVRIGPRKHLFISSPNGYDKMYNMFLSEPSDKYQVHSATVADNPFIQEGYIDDLREIYSPKLFRQDVLGEVLNLGQGAVYNDFNRDIHMAPLNPSYFVNEQIYFFTDFNVGKYAGIFVVFKDENIYIIDEWTSRDTSSEHEAPKLRAKYGTSLIVAGDPFEAASRQSKSLSTHNEIYNRNGFETINLARADVHTRITTANSRLFHKKIIVADHCTELIKDLEATVYREGTQDIDKRDPERTHHSDMFGHTVYYFLPLRKKLNLQPTNLMTKRR